MIIYAVDDEPIALRLLEKIVKDEIAGCEFSGFMFADDYMEALENRSPDIVFLDVEMPGVTGVDIARKTSEIAPKTNLIFLTGFPQYTGDAIELFASGYIMKPITVDKLRNQLEHLRYPVANEKEQLIIKTFGFFEAKYKGQSIRFEREKTRELLAFLIYKKGQPVNANEIRLAIWGEEGLDAKTNSYFHHLKRDLEKTFEGLGISETLYMGTRTYAVVPGSFECDWYDNCEYKGPFMEQYSWAVL